MAEVVYLLGAGFNCSLVTGMGPLRPRVRPPLATNFFILFLNSVDDGLLETIGRHLYVDDLFAYIEHHWKLTRDDLKAKPFDLEECMTMLQLQMPEADGDELLRLRRIEFALLGLLLGYLQDLEYEGLGSPVGRAFAEDVLGRQADVLTLNYDGVTERTIAMASGPGTYTHRSDDPDRWDKVIDDEVGDSHNAWKPGLACGVRFDEVVLPRAGVSTYVDGSRYYAHPGHDLYTATRVLKLHGSVSWLRYTGIPRFPQEIMRDMQAGLPPKGICLASTSARWTWGEPPSRGPWLMQPVVIPPQLYKRYNEFPFAEIWRQARDTLTTCKSLIVVGYSFPPTDFAIRRLLLEAFADHRPETLVVVNPDTSVVETVRRLTHFTGAAVVANELSELYGVPRSYLG